MVLPLKKSAPDWPSAGTAENADRDSATAKASNRDIRDIATSQATRASRPCHGTEPLRARVLAYLDAVPAKIEARGRALPRWWFRNSLVRAANRQGDF